MGTVVCGREVEALCKHETGCVRDGSASVHAAEESGAEAAWLAHALSAMCWLNVEREVHVVVDERSSCRELRL